MPGLASSQLIVKDGSIYIITSGSGLVPGTATTAATTASFVIDFTGEFSTGSKLLGTNTGSFNEYWSVQDPNGHFYKIFYTSASTEPNITGREPTASITAPIGINSYHHRSGSLPLYTNNSLNETGSAIQVIIDTNDSGSQIALATYNALNNYNYRMNRYNVFLGETSSSLSFYFNLAGSSSSIDSRKGATTSSDSASVLFPVTIPNSGSGYIGSTYSEGLINVTSASFTMAPILNTGGKAGFQLTGSGAAGVVFTTAGKIGVGTTTPTKDIELAGDEIKLVRRTKDIGVQMNDEGNWESFANTADMSATGSELIMKYSRGDSDNPDLATSGDVMGSIRWIADTGSSADLDSRVGGEAAKITCISDAITADGVQGRLEVHMPAGPGEPGLPVMKISTLAADVFQFTGSANFKNNLTAVSMSGEGSGITGVAATAGGSDTHIQFNDGGTTIGGDAGFTYNKTSDSITLAGDVTASGDISSSATITARDITSGNVVPRSDNSSDLGTRALRWQDVYSVSTTTGGVFEVGLRTEGLKDLPTGTIVTWKDGECVPCYKSEDQFVMGVTREGKDEPIVLGAEPILVTGNIKEGEYIVTSDVKGHGKSVNVGYLFKKNLFGKVIGQALESSEGKSSLIKCMIRKM